MGREPTGIDVTGRLAVIPKAFHQPTSDPRFEAPVSVTLRRELEEELLGRQDLEEASSAGHRHVDTLHAYRRRWCGCASAEAPTHPVCRARDSASTW
jgi:hypothetical protein